MTDREFINEMRRALIIAMRAMIKRYGLAWADLLPADVVLRWVSPSPIDETVQSP